MVTIIKGNWNARASMFVVSLLILSALAAFIVVDRSAVVSGAILYVGKGSTYSSVQDAIDDASPGDSVVIAPGQYNETLRMVKEGMTLSGNDSALTVIRAQGGAGALEVTAKNVMVSGLKFLNGSVTVSSENVTLSDLVVDRTSDPSVILGGADNLTMSDVLLEGTALEGSTGIEMNDCRGALLRRVNCSVGRLVHAMDAIDLSIMDCVFSEDEGAFLIERTDLVAFDLGGEWGSAADPLGSFILCSNVSIGNGRVVQEADSSGPVEFRDCTDVLVHDISVVSRNDGSSVLRFTDCSGLTFERIDLTMPSGGSGVGAVTERSDDVRLKDSVLSGTASAASLFHFTDGSDLTVENATFIVSGTDSFGLVFFGRGCRIANGTFEVDGERSVGLFCAGTDIFLSGNYYDEGRKDSVGASVSGARVSMENEVHFVSGEGSVGIRSSNFQEYLIEGARVRVTGTDASGIHLAAPVMPGPAMSVAIEGTIINVSDAGGQALVVEAPASSIRVNASAFNSHSAVFCADLTVATALIEGSKVHGDEFGGGLYLYGAAEARIKDTVMEGYWPCHAERSSVEMFDCDMFHLFEARPGLTAVAGSLADLYDCHLEDVMVDPTSTVNVHNSISVRTVDRFGTPVPGVDLRARSGGSDVYSTGHFQGTAPDPRTGPDGEAGPFFMTYVRYLGSSDPVFIENTVEAFLQGSSGEAWDDVYDVNASYEGTVVLVSPDIDLPMVPHNLSVTPFSAREALLLNWELNTDDTSEYWIYRLDKGTGLMVLLGKVDMGKATYATEDLGERVNATFEVRAWDGKYLSGPSERASGTTMDLTPPPLVSNLRAGEITSSSVELLWDHPGTEDLSGFEVLMNATYPSPAYELKAEADPSDRSITITGLSWGTNYFFKLISVDQSENRSPPSGSVSTVTLGPPLEVKLTVLFDDEGPMSGLPAEGSYVELLLSSGQPQGSFLTDASGKCAFTGLMPDEAYYITAEPPEGTKGAEGLRSGYLASRSAYIIMESGDGPLETVLVLPYQNETVLGTIRVNVTFGPGPRSGAVYQARVSLLSLNGSVIRTVQASGDGAASFTVYDLPFNGSVTALPPSDLEGDAQEGKAGYLGAASGPLQLTRESPAIKDLELSLPYYDGGPVVRYLYIVTRLPSGSSVNLDEGISVTFDQSMDRASVEASLVIAPALKDTVIVWSDDGKTITVEHGGFEPGTSYQVTVLDSARSLNGSSFPPGYTENIWSFRTTKEPGDGGAAGLSTFIIYLLVILTVAVLIGAVLLITMKRSGRSDREDLGVEDEDRPVLDGLDTQGHPDDLVDGMVSGMPRGLPEE